MHAYHHFVATCGSLCLIVTMMHREAALFKPSPKIASCLKPILWRIRMRSTRVALLVHHLVRPSLGILSSRICILIPVPVPSQSPFSSVILPMQGSIFAHRFPLYRLRRRRVGRWIKCRARKGRGSS